MKLRIIPETIGETVRASFYIEQVIREPENPFDVTSPMKEIGRDYVYRGRVNFTSDEWTAFQHCIEFGVVNYPYGDSEISRIEIRKSGD